MLVWTILGVVVVVATGTLVARWRIKLYMEQTIERATIFVPISAPEWTITCGCGKTSFFQESLAGHWVRAACSCGNFYQWKHLPGLALGQSFEIRLGRGEVIFYSEDKYHKFGQESVKGSCLED